MRGLWIGGLLLVCGCGAPSPTAPVAGGPGAALGPALSSSADRGTPVSSAHGAGPSAAPAASAEAALGKARAAYRRVTAERCNEKSGEKKPGGARVTDSRIELDRVIEFERGSSEIREASDPTLDAVVVALGDASIEKVEIAGHADASGDDASNVSLTSKRAASVKSWLVAHGVAEERLVTAGYGSYCPVDPGASEAAKAKNRRVEFVITRKGGKDVKPGWGGCAEAEKKGIKRPKGGKPSASGVESTWVVGAALPETVCGTSLSPSPLSGAMVLPPWVRPAPHFSVSARTRTTAELRLASRLEDVCGEKAERELSRKRFSLLAALEHYALTRTDEAARKSAFERARGLAAQLAKEPDAKTDLSHCLSLAMVDLLSNDHTAIDRVVACASSTQKELLPVFAPGLASFTAVAHEVTADKPDEADRYKALLKLAVSAVSGLQHLPLGRAVAALYHESSGHKDKAYEAWAYVADDVHFCGMSDRWLLSLAPAEVLK